MVIPGTPFCNDLPSRGSPSATVYLQISAVDRGNPSRIDGPHVESADCRRILDRSLLCLPGLWTKTVASPHAERIVTTDYCQIVHVSRVSPTRTAETMLKPGLGALISNEPWIVDHPCLTISLSKPVGSPPGRIPNLETQSCTGGCKDWDGRVVPI